MYIFKQVAAIQSKIKTLKEKGGSIGFVPTMGALHKGHLKLIETSLAKTDTTVCSIFVNPTQFNDLSDLEHYPRPIEMDIEKLLSLKSHILFIPTVAEIYPKDFSAPPFDFHGLEGRLEGEFRPGHFDGVAQVVFRLLDIVQPDYLIMGQKDYQQVQIVRKMIAQTDLQVLLDIVPTIRETSGLAMSSRNERLSKNARQDAAIIYETLRWVKANFRPESIQELKEGAVRRISQAGFKPEYFEIVDGTNMEPVFNFENDGQVVACTAVWVEGIRLIDNILI